MIVEVAPALPVSKAFYYRVASDLEKDIVPGLRVLVPFGSRFVTGYIIRILPPDEALPKDREIKPVSRILEQSPLFPPELLRLFLWISRYYHYPLGKVIEGSLPSGLNVKSRRQLLLTESGRELLEKEPESPELSPVKHLLGQGISVESLPSSEERTCILSLVEKGILEWAQVVARPRIRLKEEDAIFLNGREAQETAEEASLLDFLEAENKAVPLKKIRSWRGYKKLLRGLEQKNLIYLKKVQVFRDPLSGDQLCYNRPAVLNSDQEKAISDIGASLEEGHFCTFLLHGVTGSGKTEIYLSAVEKAIAAGKNSIVLVPEIALATRMEGAFLARFGENAAVLHSGLTPGEKLDQWIKIREGRAGVVLGARSAVFAPFSSVGLIIVDEEHDSSYKQEEKLRYQARDVAIMRASLEKAVVVLGSATPSVQSMFNARSGRYKYLNLSKRVEDRRLPQVRVVDMREAGSKRDKLFSEPLLAAVNEKLAQNEQILVFLNRRGFSPCLQCGECGHMLCCPNCTVSLTYHAADKLALCHYCGFFLPALPVCPSCRGSNIRQLGWGTERVEEELKTLFPEARIARMDRDAMSSKGRIKALLKAIQAREVDIIIGTQMVTKGHDFPQITLVGVISADLALNIPDFRASERTFQLLSQVAGRAGRGEVPGEVLIQTRNTEHYSIIRARDHDFSGFYEEETARRKILEYPPFVRLAVLIVSGNSQKTTLESAEEVARRCSALINHNKPALGNIQILGPAPCIVLKLRGKFRYQLFLKCARTGPLHSFIDYLMRDIERRPLVSGTRLTVDVDPEGAS